MFLPICLWCIVIVCYSLAILTYCMFVSNIIIIQNSLFTFPIEYFICVNPYHNTINFSWTLVKSLIIKIFCQNHAHLHVKKPFLWDFFLWKHLIIPIVIMELLNFSKPLVLKFWSIFSQENYVLNKMYTLSIDLFTCLLVEVDFY